MKGLFSALRFLTIIPVPGAIGLSREDLSTGVVFFPLVGLLVGLVASLVGISSMRVFAPWVSGVLVVITWIAMSGGLHMDGLADTADGFLSARPRDRVLEIMKDSHVGVMGVIVVDCVILVKVVSLLSMDSGALWRAAILVPFSGRCAMVVMMGLLRVARPDGLGHAFSGRRRTWEAVLTVFVLSGVSWIIAEGRGLVAASASIFATLLFAAWCRRKIGGATGDTYGAACEIAETVCVLIMSACPLAGPLL